MKSSAGVQGRELDATFVNRTAGLGQSGHGAFHRRLSEVSIVLVLAVIYLTHLTPGHVFASDDFAAYVMHAANLAEGRPYTAINYVSNPRTLWLAPPNGYPPVYPLLLAPAYKIWGLNLRALKIITTFCFVIFLLLFAEFARSMLSPAMSACALLILGFNPGFWVFRDYLLSEFPYLMFSFGALLVIQITYKELSPNEFRIGRALLLSLLLYCAYGTRTIGIVLLPALVLGDLLKFKRPSRFLILTIVCTAVFIVAQNLFLISPAGYAGAVQHSLQMALGNAVFYAKTLSYVWQNGLSKKIQIAFALAFTGLATVSFVRKLWAERSAPEFYLLGYLAMLLMLRAEIGMRGLLPILPLYLACGLQEFARIVNPLGRLSRTVSFVLLLLFVSATYAGGERRLSYRPLEPNVRDAAAQELFSFLRANTQPSEVLVFPKPRILALFTSRPVAMLAPDESPEEAYRFVKSIHATVLVTATWSQSPGKAFLEINKSRLREIFHNSEYQAYRILPDEVTVRARELRVIHADTGD